jgi:anti-sigma factor RsiW
MRQYTQDDLNAYVDGLLAPSERAGVEAWLESHPDSAELLRHYAAQNAALRALYGGVMDEPVPERLSNVRGRVFNGTRAAAAAALLLGGAVLGWFAHGAWAPANGPAASLPRQAAIAHVVYAPEVRHPVEVGADQEDHLVKWLSKRLGTDLKTPKLAALGYELVGGRLLSGPAGPVAHFMYQEPKGQRLTLYVSAQKGEHGQTAFRFSQENRVSVFYWIDGNYGYALSGEIDREALLGVANVVYKQLNP